MDSFAATHSIEINDEITKMNVYDENGYLPIHRATFIGHKVIVKKYLRRC